MSEEIATFEALRAMEATEAELKKIVAAQRWDWSVSMDTFVRTCLIYQDTKAKVAELKRRLKQIDDAEREIGSADEDRAREAETKAEILESENLAIEGGGD